MSAVIVVVILMLPTLLQKTFHIAPRLTLIGSSLATLSLTIGCILTGMLSDRYGPKRVLGSGFLLLGVTFLFLYVELRAGASTQVWMSIYALTGLWVGAIGAIPFMMVTAFPPAVRFTGISFSYNVSYAIFGGLTPILISAASAVTVLAPVLYVGLLCAIAIVAALVAKR
jgi:MFS family permease